MTVDVKCWNCGAKVKKNTFFCSNCNKIQEPLNSNEFELLGIDKKFNLDDEILENNYLKLQQILHPDNFSILSDKEIKYSTIFSSMVNNAYQKLSCANLRAEALLKLKGLNNYDESETFQNTEILEEIMEIQNKCRNKSDEKAIKETSLELDDKILKTLSELSSSFDDEDYKKASQLNIKLSYLEKLKKTLKGLV